MCTYLAKRGATYYFCRGIPAELRPALDGRAEFMISLRTTRVLLEAPTQDHGML